SRLADDAPRAGRRPNRGRGSTTHLRGRGVAGTAISTGEDAVKDHLNERMLISLLLIATACGAGDRHEKPGEGHGDEHGHEAKEDHHEGDEHGEGETAKTEPNVVRIDPGMLRDLRITTAKSESRPAGETVNVLGEVQLNQAAYAEVASPIPARVRAVL